MKWQPIETAPDKGVMTDRELLEAAAKAAGVDGVTTFEGRFVSVEDGRSGYFWNPLEDDGDALRLAIRPGVSIEPYPLYAPNKHAVVAKIRMRSDQLREANPTECVEQYGDDSHAATRRAIVRAAAMAKEVKT